MSRIDFLGHRIDSLTKEETLNAIGRFVDDRTPRYVVTPNTDIIIKMEKDKKLGEICDNADLILTDGQVLVIISKMLDTPIKERLCMTDFIWDLCEYAQDKGFSIFLFGGKDNVLKNGRKYIERKYPNLKIAGHYSPPFGFEKDHTELEKTNDILKESKADILIVFLGCPKQEYYIYNNKEKYMIPVSITMGGCIDYFGGDIKRAPLWMQKNGLEWLFRFYQEPRRLFKRYFIDDMKILPLFLKYKFLK
jgi:N-acetylglucosaminyldiphosphoundecaprenol N-acetyl-beta-D-mannosaminyltransferase